MRTRMKPGCSICDHCKREVLAWTIREKLIGGIFYSLCKPCQQEETIKKIKEEQAKWKNK